VKAFQSSIPPDVSIPSKLEPLIELICFSISSFGLIGLSYSHAFFPNFEDSPLFSATTLAGRNSMRLVLHPLLFHTPSPLNPSCFVLFAWINHLPVNPLTSQDVQNRHSFRRHFLRLPLHLPKFMFLEFAFFPPTCAPPSLPNLPPLLASPAEFTLSPTLHLP